MQDLEAKVATHVAAGEASGLTPVQMMNNVVNRIKICADRIGEAATRHATPEYCRKHLEELFSEMRDLHDYHGAVLDHFLNPPATDQTL